MYFEGGLLVRNAEEVMGSSSPPFDKKVHSDAMLSQGGSMWINAMEVQPEVAALKPIYEDMHDPVGVESNTLDKQSSHRIPVMPGHAFYQQPETTMAPDVQNSAFLPQTSIPGNCKLSSTSVFTDYGQNEDSEKHSQNRSSAITDAHEAIQFQRMGAVVTLMPAALTTVPNVPVFDRDSYATGAATEEFRIGKMMTNGQARRKKISKREAAKATAAAALAYNRALAYLASTNQITDEELLRLKPKKTRRAARFDNAVPSKYCHICSRSPKNVRLAACTKIKLGTCRKVICEKCFGQYNFGNFEAALNITTSTWVCTHCTESCPSHAQCINYQRVNDQLRIQRLKQSCLQECGASCCKGNDEHRNDDDNLNKPYPMQTGSEKTEMDFHTVPSNMGRTCLLQTTTLGQDFLDPNMALEDVMHAASDSMRVEVNTALNTKNEGMGMAMESRSPAQIPIRSECGNTVGMTSPEKIYDNQASHGNQQSSTHFEHLQEMSGIHGMAFQEEFMFPLSTTISTERISAQKKNTENTQNFPQMALQVKSESANKNFFDVGGGSAFSEGTSDIAQSIESNVNCQWQSKVRQCSGFDGGSILKREILQHMDSRAVMDSIDGNVQTALDGMDAISQFRVKSEDSLA